MLPTKNRIKVRMSPVTVSFNIVLEVLTNVISQEKEIKYIKIRKK